MLIEDLEKNIYVIGGRKINYQDLLENTDEYFYFSKEQVWQKVEYRTMRPDEFFYAETEARLPEDITCLFYSIPFREPIDAERREIESNKIYKYVKKMLLYVASIDNMNTFQICPYFHLMYHLMI